jgi:hypothetical protein
VTELRTCTCRTRPSSVLLTHGYIRASVQCNSSRTKMGDTVTSHREHIRLLRHTSCRLSWATVTLTSNTSTRNCSSPSLRMPLRQSRRARDGEPPRHNTIQPVHQPESQPSSVAHACPARPAPTTNATRRRNPTRARTRVGRQRRAPLTVQTAAPSTYLHSNSTASRNLHGLFHATMKPLTSLTSSFALPTHHLTPPTPPLPPAAPASAPHSRSNSRGTHTPAATAATHSGPRDGRRRVTPAHGAGDVALAAPSRVHGGARLRHRLARVLGRRDAARDAAGFAELRGGRDAALAKRVGPRVHVHVAPPSLSPSPSSRAP